MLLEYAVLSQDNHLFIPAEVLVIVVWFGVLAALIIIIIEEKAERRLNFVQRIIYYEQMNFVQHVIYHERGAHHKLHVA